MRSAERGPDGEREDEREEEGELRGEPWCRASAATVPGEFRFRRLLRRLRRLLREPEPACQSSPCDALRRGEPCASSLQRSSSRATPGLSAIAAGSDSGRPMAAISGAAWAAAATESADMPGGEWLAALALLLALPLALLLARLLVLVLALLPALRLVLLALLLVLLAVQLVMLLLMLLLLRLLA